MKGTLTKMNLTDRTTLQSTMYRNEVRGDTLPRDLEPQQWAGLYSALGATETATATANNPSAAPKQNKKSQEKGTTMRNDKGHKDPSTTAGTGEIPIVGAGQANKKLEAQIPGFDDDAKAKSHDKGHMQAERGFMPQHGKPSQPQPRWNLPRR